MSNNFKGIINPYKKRVIKSLISSFANSKNIGELSKVDKSDIRRVLVARPNHRLGNQLLLSPLIQTLENEFPNCKIDLVVNGNLSEVLFENYDSVEKVHSLPKRPFENLPEYIKTSSSIISSKYDLAIAGDESSNSSKIFLKLSRARFKIFTSEKGTNASDHIAKKPIDNLMSILNKRTTNYPKLNIKLSDTEAKMGRDLLQSLFTEHAHTVAIFTNATGDKKLSKEWWGEFCSKLEKSLPNINILEILPRENKSQVDFRYKTYLSYYLREMAAVIENCSVFIGADSGVMHLASSTNTATFGLFNGLTNPDVYGPYGGHNRAVETNETEIDQVIAEIEKYVDHNG